MAKFINTKYKNTVSSLIDGLKSSLDNPYYIFTDSKPTLVTYYNINTKKTSLDDGLESAYNIIGKGASLRFNKINDFYLYGLDKITMDLENDEFGLQSSPLEGEAIILPNTIIPIPNDYFTISYDKENVMFKVLEVNVDTLENGMNFYKIQYKADQPTDTGILDQIAEEYSCIISNIGTQSKIIVKKDEYDLLGHIDNISVRLKEYYKALFYSDRVQSFILDYNANFFYDPCLIEFIIKNKVMDGSGEYLYVTHQLGMSKTFILDYDKTFFRLVEYPELRGTRPLINSQGKYIDDPLSIFSTRLENYYELKYIGNEHVVNPSNYVINNFEPELIDKIYNNKKYVEPTYKNIIIKYINGEIITKEDIFALENIKFDTSINLFYQMPILIFILDNVMKKLISKK